MLAIGKADHNGFTLIEMLVVIAILGLISGIAFPALERTITQQRYRMATGAVEAALNEARAAAVSKGAETPVALPPLSEGIAIDMTQGGIRFYNDGSASGGSVTVIMGPRKTRFIVDPVTGLIGPNR